MKPSYLVHPSMKTSSSKPAEKPEQKQEQLNKQSSKGSSKEKDYEGIRKFPRPLVSQEESKIKHVHSAKMNFEEPPSLFYNYTVKDEGNATCRHARSSIYSVPDSTSAHTKSKISFSVVR